ncbi:hypothetical protein IGI04_038137 [Brassica rapa subsp. trilocularis]|uniref:Uncharacterized protein n=1 Tax=Brassica rapa subsp. trilocularis TaxID=1813537 RepID=A0ABQ7LK93_BRACM|nr:hypothetical protein IGI04_038137 [Brassica rapa subsp. trilocularis]
MMSSQLAHVSTITRTQNPPFSSSHHHQFLSQRTYIPAKVYEHPAALLLERCSSLEDLRRVLPLVFKNGLSQEHLFQTKLVSLFCRYGSVVEAARVFDAVDVKLDVLYHTMLKGYAKVPDLDKAVSFFVRMRCDDVEPVVYNFTYLLKACGDEAELGVGKEVHGLLVKSGFSLDLFAMTGLENMYAKCRQVHEARKVFDRMPERDLVSWNTMVSGYSQNGLARMALEMVALMCEENLKPSFITVVSVLPAVSALGLIRIGKEIHGYAMRAGFDSLVNVSTALVDMYAKCGSLNTARRIFDGMLEKNVVSWNSMIDAYVQNENPKEAMVVFQKMLDEGVKPTDVSIMGALHACADLGDLERGRFIHKLSVELDLDRNVSVVNSLISMYCKCKDVDTAASLFGKLRTRTLVSWNAMILGFAQNGRPIEALNYFSQMRAWTVKPDTFTYVSVITALAELSVTHQAKWIHGVVMRNCLDKNVFVATALVDMYAKCGAITTARKVFDMMSERHVTTWNAMIDGYGTHGIGKAALELFEEMRKGNVKPNGVTFLSVISACSHSGLVEAGVKCFHMMKEGYSIEPSMDHYGAMVDLLGRAGLLNEAWDFIAQMPVKPAVNVYGAMLGACQIHKNVSFAEKAAERLFELNPDDGGYHVLLANIYRAASMWEKVGQVRVSMLRQGLRKTPGCSMVEIKNEVHSFFSGSTDHPSSKEIYTFLEKLMCKIKEAGYVPDTKLILGVEDDIKEQLLSSHSEKLAISFGLLNTTAGTTIHVRKNLRVCADCHNATKYISLVTGREIVVRDMQRFHHFKNGVYILALDLSKVFWKRPAISRDTPLSFGQTLSSPGGTYELGFFSPNNSQNQYIGIWFKKITPRVVVWVANREKPITNPVANLTTSGNGSLILLDSRNNVVWSTKEASTSNKCHAKLLDTGNLVVVDDVSGSFLWQSFENLGDTMLPLSSLMYNIATKEKRVLTSWKTDTDPSPGEFVVQLTSQVPAQIVTMKGDRVYKRSGPWSKTVFTGIPKMDGSYASPFSLFQDIESGTGSFSYLQRNSGLTRVIITSEGYLKTFHYNGTGWVLDFVTPENSCDLYGTCGPYGLCVKKSTPTTCECMKGFVPKFKEEWKRGNMSSGCVRHTELSFSQLEAGQPRLLPLCNQTEGGMTYFVYYCGSSKIHKDSWKNGLEQQEISGLTFFDMNTIRAATNNFNVSNKLGQGGFGPVYKGITADKKEIAVKRLSSSSGQGTEEFMNEIKLISKLQHRNLVRLLGCCIDGEEKLLIYEFMVNKSLDSFLFDMTLKLEIDWPKRFNIIQGVARGLLYLHRDSCLKVIHRDMKVSNILLDENMDPKISDFGLARMVQGTQHQDSTRRVVGTIGYMSPEYAWTGMFSEKSDIYAFGVLQLEIISGMKISSFNCGGQGKTLLEYAWETWLETGGVDLLDQAIASSCSPDEVARCVQIGLLCIQQQAVDRPNIAQVVSMITTTTELPTPKQPVFAVQTQDQESTVSVLESVNHMTQTAIHGR